MWLFYWFCISDLDNSTTSIRQISHIKTLFIKMLHQIWNFKYSKHFKITNFIGLKSLLFVINLDYVSSSTVFNILIFVFTYI